MSTETIRLIRDWGEGVKGVWRWGEEGDYIYIYYFTLSPPE